MDEQRVADRLYRFTEWGMHPWFWIVGLSVVAVFLLVCLVAPESRHHR